MISYLNNLNEYFHLLNLLIFFSYIQIYYHNFIIENHLFNNLIKKINHKFSLD